MKKLLAVAIMATMVHTANAQPPSNTAYKKGSLYFFWGWNRDFYTKSDIHFRGDYYDFTLKNVVAHDKQSRFEANTYLNPRNFTIPQTNFRIGYFINDHYNISFGFDHMKYVVDQFQTVKISGHIDGASPYQSVYDNDDISLTEDFLQFEHTDGLNYLNLELRRFDEIFRYRFLSFGLTEGLGAGVLMPKTNSTFLNNPRNDEFHLAGLGVSGIVGLNVTFFRNFFIQTELKGGYINMPDILITSSSHDKAKQDFFFLQSNVVLGAVFHLGSRKSRPLKADD